MWIKMDIGILDNLSVGENRHALNNCSEKLRFSLHGNKKKIRRCFHGKKNSEYKGHCTRIGGL